MSGRTWFSAFHVLVLFLLMTAGVCFPNEQQWKELVERADKLCDEGNYREAVKTARQALEVAEKTFGPDHVDTAVTLSLLAQACRRQGLYQEAEAHCKRALEIREKALGHESIETAQSLNELAGILDFQGRYSSAEPLYLRSLRICRKLLGDDDRYTGLVMNNLSMLYDKQGRYSEAEPLLLKALAITEKASGPERSDTARSLSNLAMLYLNQGRYGEAEPLMKRALAIREKALGQTHPGTAKMMCNLAALYRMQGRYQDAGRLYEKAIEAEEKALGASHPSVARNLDNLAALYMVMGRYSEAGSLLERALQIREKALGPDHPDTAISLCSLAVLYRNRGRFAEAERLLQRALKIYGKALGPEHPDTQAVTYNLAVLYQDMMRRHEAETLLRGVLANYEKALGTDHPDLAIVLCRLGCLHAVSGRPGDALPEMLRALSIDDRTISNVFAISSEREKFAFLGTVQNHYEIFLNFIIQYQSGRPEALKAGLDAVLRRKGKVLDALSLERKALLESGKPEAKALYSKLLELSSVISSLTLAGPGRMQMDEYRERLRALESEREKIEKALTASSTEYAARKRSTRADCRAVSEKLPPGSALVEYLCLPLYDFKAAAGNRKWRGSRYFAFILKSSKGDGPAGPEAAAPSLVDLGDASAVDEAVKEFRAEIMNARTLCESGILNEAEAEKQLAVKGRRLYDLAVLPLKKHLGPAATLFLAPDGDLNLIPFGALKDEAGRYLVEQYCIDYLTSGRDLPGFEGKAANTGETVIISSPDFDMSSEERSAATSAVRVKGASDTMRRSECSSDFSMITWSPLPGAAMEAEMIGKALKGDRLVKYQGRTALEETLKSLRSPRRLHIATHGFFLEDLADSGSLPTEGSESPVTGFSKADTAYAAYKENPLLRSGLALAGANRVGRETVREGCDDGILTALEISGLPLDGTDLVVLSACDTGLGEVSRGEGVLGLRRAFHLAGARTVVMSLWSVPDIETQQIMSEFYKRLRKGDGKARALSGAGLAVLKERREKYGAAHPFFWAPFICVGEP